jgi:SH3 domain protein
MSFPRLLLSLVLFLVAAAPVFGETVYVSDRLIITLRVVPDGNGKIINTLKSDTPLEVLEPGEKYLRVRTPKGEEGYVLTQYISQETPKTVLIDQLEHRLAESEKAIDNLRAKEKDSEQSAVEAKHREELLRQQAGTAEESRQTLQKQLDAVTQEYAALRHASENVAEIVAERDRLTTENNSLSARLKKMEAETSQHFYTAAIQWFLAGAGVLLVGWFLGKISRRKRSLY